jgi:hypothetical protein
VLSFCGGWELYAAWLCRRSDVARLAAILNRWIKPSNHVAFAMFTGILPSRFALGLGSACCFSLLLLAGPEVLGGMVLGPLPRGLNQRRASYG